MSQEKRDVFNREARYFKADGTEYRLEFIPSEHFNGVLIELLSLAVKLGFQGVMTLTDEGVDLNKDSFVKAARTAAENILKNQVYDLMADVINWQNPGVQKGITPHYLKKRLTVMELTKFIGLIMNDDEVLDAVEVFIEEAGKLLCKVPGRVEALTEKVNGLNDGLQTLKYTPS